MDKELKNGVMVLSLKESILMTENMGKANYNWLMAQNTSVNSNMVSFKVKANISGRVANNMTDSGKTARWKEQEDCSGQMESSTEVNLNKIDSMDKVFTVGQMVKSTMENGLKANNTEREV